MENKSDIKNTNIGISLLKALMCFEVVLIHFWNKNDTSIFLKPFSILDNFAVPVFMFISFFFTYKTFLKKDNNLFLKRIKRLVIPLFLWNIIYFSVYGIEKFFIPNKIINFKILLIHFLFGSFAEINPAMWFLNVLIFISFIFFIIFKFQSEKNGIKTIIILFFISLMLQYAGFVDFVFKNTINEIKAVIGLFIEMLSYAVTGFIFGYFNILEKLKKYKSIIAVVSILSLIVLIKIKSPIAPGFGYSRLKDIFIVPVLFLLFYYIPFQKIPQNIQTLAVKITKYTFGIYCIHFLVGVHITLIFEKFNIHINSFIICILIYLISYFTSFLISHIPYKVSKALVE